MADPQETARIRALRDQIEGTLNILPRHLRANTRPDKTFPVEPVLSSAEVDEALMRYAPSLVEEEGKEMREREVIVIDDSDDEVLVVREGKKVNEIKDESESEGEREERGRGRKRVKLDLEVSNDGVVGVTVDGGGEGGFDMAGAELEDHAFVAEHGESTEDESEDSSDSGDDGSDGDVQVKDEAGVDNNHLSGMDVSDPSMNGEEDSKEIERKIPNEPAHKKSTKEERKLRKKMKKQLEKRTKRKYLPLETIERMLTDPTLSEGKRRFLAKQKQKIMDKKVMATMSVLEKVAVRRQKKIDRGVQLPEVVDMFPGKASFDNEVRLYSGGGQFGDDFVGFADTKEKDQEAVLVDKKSYMAVEVKDDPFSNSDYIGFDDLENEVSTPAMRDADSTVVKIEDGVPSKKRRRQS